MDRRARAYVAGAGAVGVFLLVQLGALALVQPFKAAGFQAVEDPADPTNSLVYVALILVVTVLMLAAIKLDLTWLVRGSIILASGAISLYVFLVLVPPVVTVEVAGARVNVLAVAAAAGLALALYVYPEWYVIDAAGVVMGMGAAGIFGISFGVLPALVLLVVLAVYDAISVYGTEHMLTLASGVMDLRVPVLLVIPLTLSYSFLDHGARADTDTDTDAAAESNGGSPGETAKGGREHADGSAGEAPGPLERDAFFVGLGDAVIPAVLVASAGFFAPPSVPTLVPGLAVTLPAALAMLGTVAGLVVLLGMVMQGRAHAGLPLLNGGAIVGYLAGALASGIPLVEALGLAPYL